MTLLSLIIIIARQTPFLEETKATTSGKSKTSKEEKISPIAFKSKATNA